jgi:hypothetical protein
MILANGCSHTHGTQHAVTFKYKNKLWPHIAAEILGETDVVNLAKGGDSAMSICDSTIHWLETNTIKPSYVLIQWTYANRHSIPSAMPYYETPFRYYNRYRGDPDFYRYLAKMDHEYDGRRGLRQVTFTDWYLKPSGKPRKDNWSNFPIAGLVDLDQKELETSAAKRRVQHIGLEFPPWLWDISNNTGEHPYFIREHPNPEIQKRIDEVRRYINYREALADLPVGQEVVFKEWAMAQNHLAAYCKANDIPYYWWGCENWFQPEFCDLMYLKPKHGDMFGYLGQFELWLQRQGIIGNGDYFLKYEDREDVEATEQMYSHHDMSKDVHLPADQFGKITKPKVYKKMDGRVDDSKKEAVIDEHRGEDGHKYIGELVGNYIKYGTKPDPQQRDVELLKKNIEARPSLKKATSWASIQMALTEESYNPIDPIDSTRPIFYYD